MRRLTLCSAGAVIVGAGTAALLAVPSASASDGSRAIRVHEASAGATFLDLGTTGASLGDELVGANTLSAKGRDVGSDSFVCTTVSPDGSSLLCNVVYTLPQGRISGQGFAKIVGTKPLFDEEFAITGGTGSFAAARGQVRVVQNSQQDADLSFQLR